MRAELTQEEIKKGWILHNKAKNHPFRKDPQLYLLDEYKDILMDMYHLVALYKIESEKTVNGKHVTIHMFHDAVSKMLNVPWSKEPQRVTIDIWSNPGIAIINEAIHDLNAITWTLRYSWHHVEEIGHQEVLGRFIEYTETFLMVFHKLLEGIEVNNVKFPKQTGDRYTEYIFVQNPRYNNLWTYPFYLKDEIYVTD